MKFHKEDLGFIEEQLKAAKHHGELAVVLTHHSPLSSCPGDGADLSALIKKYDSHLLLWCYGHTHRSSRKMYEYIDLR